MPIIEETTANRQDSRLAAALQRLLLALEGSGRAVLPSSNDELLQTVVEAAARIFGAAAASIALVDEQDKSLVFRVAYGAGRDEVLGMRVPMGQGIVGYVALTGQPLAVSNVQQDPRFARDTAAKTGYVPRSILAMPLLLRDRVIGVMEVLDKISAPSFGLQDMELLALFARQAAIAIDQSQQFARLNEAFKRGLAQLLTADQATDCDEITQALRENEDAAREHDVLALADLFNSIALLGASERRVCLQVLNAFAEHARRGE